MGGSFSAISPRSSSPHVIFFHDVLLVTILISFAFQLSCSGCSEEESGAGSITDTENVLSDTATASAAGMADTVDTETTEATDSGDVTPDSGDIAADKGSAVGIVSGGAQIQTNKYQMRVTVGSGAAASGKSENYRMDVGVGAQTTR